MKKNLNLLNNITQGNCLDVMKEIEDKSIDMILCDLPYGTTQNKWDVIIPFNDFVTINNKKYDYEEYLIYAFKLGITYNEAIRFFKKNKEEGLWSLYNRILKDKGVIVLTSSGIFTQKMIMSNTKMFKYRLVWEKSKSTNFLNSKKQPLRKYEDVCVFYKKQPTYNPQMSEGESYNKGTRKSQLTGSYGDFAPVEVKSDGKRYPTDIIYFKTAESEGEVYHPTQKPIELGRYLIKTYTNPGDVVLDNTSGSGSFLVAAMLEGRDFIGIELNEDSKQFKEEDVDFIEVTKERLKEHYASVTEENKAMLSNINIIKQLRG